MNSSKLSSAPDDALITLTHGQYRAAINPRGGGLVYLSFNDHPLIDGYPEPARPPYSAGQLLAPWPNRTGDGRFSHHGKEYSLPINELARGNAIHGLATDQIFEVVGDNGSQAHADISEPQEAGRCAVTLATRFGSEQGWPWDTLFTATYTLTDDGLSCRYEARGPKGTPFAFGFHPYLNAAGAPATESYLQAPIAYELGLDERMLPDATLQPTQGPTQDSLHSAPIGWRSLDNCYLLLPNTGNEYEVKLLDHTGRGVAMHMSANLPWLQMFFAGPANGCEFPLGRGTAIAIEPMSAPPNALNVTANDAEAFADKTGNKVPADAFQPELLRGDDDPVTYEVRINYCDQTER